MADALDPRAIAQLRELMGEDFCLLITTFLADSSSRMTDIEGELSGSNHERLRRSAHSLKGMCLNLGASQLVTALVELEFAIRTRQDQSFVRLFKTVQNEYAQVRKAAAELGSG